MQPEPRRAAAARTPASAPPQKPSRRSHHKTAPHRRCELLSHHMQLLVQSSSTQNKSWPAGDRLDSRHCAQGLLGHALLCHVQQGKDNWQPACSLSADALYLLAGTAANNNNTVTEQEHAPKEMLMQVSASWRLSQQAAQRVTRATQ